MARRERMDLSREQRDQMVVRQNESASFRLERLSESVFYALDSLTRSFLWLCFAAIVVLTVLARLSTGAFVFFTIVYSFFSFVAHLIREIASCWGESPYWRSSKLRRFDKRVVSAPILCAGTWCVVTSSFLLGSRFAIVVFAHWFLCDAIIAFLLQNRCEHFVYSIKTLLGLSLNETRSSLPFIGLKDEDASRSIAKLCDCEELDSVCAVESDEGGVVLSNQTRSLTKEGSLVVSGKICEKFDANSERVVVYISFCPPFETIPTFDFEQTSERPLSIEVASLQTFGVRLEVERRLETNESTFGDSDPFTIEYYAVVPAK